MTIHNLQRYLETSVPGACVPVDLLKIAESISSSSESYVWFDREHGSYDQYSEFQHSRRRPRGMGVSGRSISICGRRGGNLPVGGGRGGVGSHAPPPGFDARDEWKVHHRIDRRGYGGPCGSAPCASYLGTRDGRRPRRGGHFHSGFGGRGRGYSSDKFGEDQFYSGGDPKQHQYQQPMHGYQQLPPLSTQTIAQDRYDRLVPQHELTTDSRFDLYSQEQVTNFPSQQYYSEQYFGWENENYGYQDPYSSLEYYHTPTYHQASQGPYSSLQDHGLERTASHFNQPSHSMNKQSYHHTAHLTSTGPEHHFFDACPSYDSSYYPGGDGGTAGQWPGWGGAASARGCYNHDSKHHPAGSARGTTHSSISGQPFSLVLDAEGCLDRLYGGYYSDWVCGGQWSRMFEFLTTLFTTTRQHSLHLTTFFNGALEPQRMGQWVQTQREARTNINSVLRHVNLQGSPPPKVWWVPPTGLHTALRLALRHLNMDMVVSMDDHHQEVIGYCRENCLDGVMASDADYIVFDPPRYFSSQHLKLTYKGSLETLEFLLGEVCRGLAVPRDRMCLLAALLPNFLLTEQDLRHFHGTLLMLCCGGGHAAQGDVSLASHEDIIRCVCNFISLRCCGSVGSGLHALAVQVFGSEGDHRVAKLCASVQYFLNGTQEGFLRYQGSAHLPSKGGDAATSALQKTCSPTATKMTEQLKHKAPIGDETFITGDTADVTKNQFPGVTALKHLQEHAVEGRRKDSAVKRGKDARSASVPTLVVTKEDESEECIFDTRLPVASRASSSPDQSLPYMPSSSVMSPVSSSRSVSSTPSLSSLSSSSVIQSVPSSSSVASRISSVGATATGFQMFPSSSISAYAPSSSPKLRTRRHNSVPLLRNIPIICEIVEEDTYTNGTSDQPQPKQSSPPDCSGSSRGQHESVGSGRDYEETATFNVNRDSGDQPSLGSAVHRSGGKSLITIGKRTTCPAIKITATFDEATPQVSTGFSILSMSKPSSCIQVPQIVIEVSEAPEDEARPETFSNRKGQEVASGSSARFSEIPSIDITPVDDDTDVEADLNEMDESTVTCSTDVVQSTTEGKSSGGAYDIDNAEIGRSEGSYVPTGVGARPSSGTFPKPSPSCRKCGSTSIGVDSVKTRELSPSSSNSSGSLSPVELEQAIESKLGKLEFEGRYSKPKGGERRKKRSGKSHSRDRDGANKSPDRLPRGLARTTGQTEVCVSKVTSPKDVAGTESPVREYLAHGDAAGAVLDPAYECDDESDEVGDSRPRSESSPRHHRRRKIGHHINVATLGSPDDEEFYLDSKLIGNTKWPCNLDETLDKNAPKTEFPSTAHCEMGIISTPLIPAIFVEGSASEEANLNLAITDGVVKDAPHLESPTIPCITTTCYETDTTTPVLGATSSVYHPSFPLPGPLASTPDYTPSGDPGGSSGGDLMSPTSAAAAKLSVPSLPSASRKTSDESSTCSRRTSASSSAAPELMALQSCADDTISCGAGNFSNVSSRRTSAASVAGDLSSPQSGYAPPSPQFGEYSSSAGVSPSVSRRVSASSACGGEGGAGGSGPLDHDSGGGCLSTASGSPGASLLLSSSSSSSNSSAASPYRLTPDTCWLQHHYRANSPDSGTSETSDTLGYSLSVRTRRASSSLSPTPTSPSPPSLMPHSASPTQQLRGPASTETGDTLPGSGAGGRHTDSSSGGGVGEPPHSMSTECGGVCLVAPSSLTASPYDKSASTGTVADTFGSASRGSLLHSAAQKGFSGGVSQEPRLSTAPVPPLATLPPVAHEILRTASERHQKGLMHPWVYQMFTQGEIKLPPYLEQEVEEGYATFADFFRPLRQTVYAILFNLHHLSFAARKARQQGKGTDTDKTSAGEGQEPTPASSRRNSNRVSFCSETVVIEEAAAGLCAHLSGDGDSSEAPEPSGSSPAETDRLHGSIGHRSQVSGDASPEHTSSDERPASSTRLTPPSIPVSTQDPSAPARGEEEKDKSLDPTLENTFCVPTKFSPSSTERPVPQQSYSVPHSQDLPTLTEPSEETGHEVSTSQVVPQPSDGSSGEPSLFPDRPEVVIREWVYGAGNMYQVPVLVPAVPLSWPAPTVNRLWFGCTKDDSKRRIRAFVSCLRSDSPLMMHPNYVPPRLLLMAAVLRYLVSSEEGSALTRRELDAFLVTAFSSTLGHVAFLQDLQLPQLSSRGIQVAALFMAGVEAAVFANDACGGPVAWWLLGPWAYFDGKLFHYTLLRANTCSSIAQLCDNDIELMARVENCRRAILENLNVTFAQVSPHDYPHPLNPLHPSSNPSHTPPQNQQQQQHHEEPQASSYGGRCYGTGGGHVARRRGWSLCSPLDQWQGFANPLDQWQSSVSPLGGRARRSLQVGGRGNRGRSCTPTQKSVQLPIYSKFPASVFTPSVRLPKDGAHTNEAITDLKSGGQGANGLLTATKRIKNNKKKTKKKDSKKEVDKILRTTSSSHSTVVRATACDMNSEKTKYIILKKNATYDDLSELSTDASITAAAGARKACEERVEDDCLQANRHETHLDTIANEIGKSHEGKMKKVTFANDAPRVSKGVEIELVTSGKVFGHDVGERRVARDPTQSLANNDNENNEANNERLEFNSPSQEGPDKSLSRGNINYSILSLNAESKNSDANPVDIRNVPPSVEAKTSMDNILPFVDRPQTKSSILDENGNYLTKSSTEDFREFVEIFADKCPTGQTGVQSTIENDSLMNATKKLTKKTKKKKSNEAKGKGQGTRIAADFSGPGQPSKPALKRTGSPLLEPRVPSRASLLSTPEVQGPPLGRDVASLGRNAGQFTLSSGYRSHADDHALRPRFGTATSEYPYATRRQHLDRCLEAQSLGPSQNLSQHEEYYGSLSSDRWCRDGMTLGQFSDPPSYRHVMHGESGPFICAQPSFVPGGRDLVHVSPAYRRRSLLEIPCRSDKEPCGDIQASGRYLAHSGNMSRHQNPTGSFNMSRYQNHTGSFNMSRHQNHTGSFNSLAGNFSKVAVSYPRILNQAVSRGKKAKQRGNSSTTRTSLDNDNRFQSHSFDRRDSDLLTTTRSFHKSNGKSSRHKLSVDDLFEWESPRDRIPVADTREGFFGIEILGSCDTLPKVDGILMETTRRKAASCLNLTSYRNTTGVDSRHVLGVGRQNSLKEEAIGSGLKWPQGVGRGNNVVISSYLNKPN